MKSKNIEKLYIINPFRGIAFTLPLVGTLLFMAGIVSVYNVFFQTDAYVLPSLNIYGSAEANDDVQFVIEDFERELQPQDDGHASIKGARATLMEDDVYKIEDPHVILRIKQQVEDPEEDAQDEKRETELVEVTLTAKNAELDKDNQTIRMSESVETIGPDFEIFTESIRYDAPEGTLLSNETVALNRYEFNEEGEKWKVLSIVGNGMEADLTSQRIKIGGESVTTINQVSHDFFASGEVENNAGADELQTIQITAAGTMTYSHLLQVINYDDNVRVSANNRKLNCDNLVITIEQQEGEGDIVVRRIDAEGNVEFEFDGQFAEGDKLEWRNFTQLGKLHGSPAVLKTDDAVIKGDVMDFYRLSSRLRIDGSGELIWAGEIKNGDKDVEQDAAITPFSPRHGVHITWEGGMVFNEGNNARFEKNVVVKQEEVKMQCGVLELEFAPETGLFAAIEAQQNVKYKRDTQSITAHNLSWYAESNILKTSAKDEEFVVFLEPPQILKSKEIHYDVENDFLYCPTKGELTLNSEIYDATPEQTPLLEISWNERMEWRGGEEAYFQGSVESIQPGRSLSAENLKIIFDEERNPAKIVASGNAELTVGEDSFLNLPIDDEEYAEPEGENANDNESESPNNDKNQTSGGEQARSRRIWQLKSDEIVGYVKKEILKSEMPGELTIFNDTEHEQTDDRIVWNESMELNMGKLHAIFRGDVHAFLEGASLKCQQLQIDIDENRQLRYLNASGNVRFDSNDEAGWELASDNASAVFNPRGQLDHLIARGQVSVSDVRSRLRAEQMRMFFSSDESTEDRILSRLTARGDVNIWYEDDEEEIFTQGSQVEWQRDIDQYEIVGEPAAIRQNAVELEAELIIVNRQDGEVSLPKGSSPAETRMRER